MPLLPAELLPYKREPVLLAGRAAYHQAARSMQEADRDYKELLARFPDTPNANYAYGIFQLNDAPDAALESFRRELQVKPDNLPAMLQLAFEYIKRNDFEQALPFARKSVATAPEFFTTHNALGRVLLGLGKTNEAIKELETGVKQAPDSPEMRFALARAYTKARRPEDAKREREIFLQLDKQMRDLREGAHATGGVDAEPANQNQPPQ
jgi:tetratricopeptide (TPR) repeat protein